MITMTAIISKSRSITDHLKSKPHLRSEVLMTVSIMMVLSWVLALCGFIGWRNMLSPSSWLMGQDWEVEDFYGI
jgi:hypothetical protein